MFGTIPDFGDFLLLSCVKMYLQMPRTYYTSTAQVQASKQLGIFITCIIYSVIVVYPRSVTISVLFEQNFFAISCISVH